MPEVKCSVGRKEAQRAQQSEAGLGHRDHGARTQRKQETDGRQTTEMELAAKSRRRRKKTETDFLTEATELGHGGGPDKRVKP